VLFDAGKIPSTFLLNEDWIHPFDEWRDELDSDTISAIEWIFPTLEQAYSGLDWANIPFLPFATRAFAPITARRDHFEQAGLDPKNDFPPESQQEYIEIGEQLKADGPAEYPLHILADGGDFLDSGLPPWTVSQGGPIEGRILNEDFTDTNFTNDSWTQTFDTYHGIYADQDLAGPWSPTAPDEDVPPKMAAGDISMGHAEILTLPLWQENAPGLVEDETIMWGPHWGGPEDQPGVLDAFFLGISKKPPAVDQETWNARQDASIELMKTWLSEDFQRQIAEDFGLIPIRDDVWDDLSSQYRDDHIFNASLEMVQNTDATFAGHPSFVAIFTENAAFLQNAMRGEISTEEALQQAHEHTMDLL
jgi:ABC-type glycerol-3-phosphate transport system substrate-binding protein